MPGAPNRITIRPDDYHVPYAGTAGDGRKFFLSDELFTADASYVGLFLWTADGAFDSVQVDSLSRPSNVPPGQAAPGVDGDEVVQTRLKQLGKYVLEPIEVAPFLRTVDGVEFGWRFEVFEGTATVNIEPGDFIAYYEPWDGYEYDT